MKRCSNPRGFLNAVGVAGLEIGSAGAPRLWAVEPVNGAPHAEEIGWRLGCHAYSFNRFTLFDAIERTACLGLRSIEAYEGQKLSNYWPNVFVTEALPGDVRKSLKQKLADSGAQLACDFADNESRAVFEFTKEMDAETLVTEPRGSFDTLDKLCAEYEINVAIANHAKPTTYWSPDIVLKVCQGRSKRFGASADTAHRMRSGLNPTECLRKLEGRIISVHFRDMNEARMNGHDVPFGSGACDVKGMLAESYRQEIKAVFSIEYGYNVENNLPEIARCIRLFDETAAELVAKG
jgi:sugar phosphate isomerase/epimerase